jgi:hypothetical protein
LSTEHQIIPYVEQAPSSLKKTIHLMWSREIISVASDSDKRHKYIVRENEAFLNIAPGGTYMYRWGKNIYITPCIPYVLFSFQCEVTLMWN